MKQRFLTLILAAALALSLSGCGKKPANNAPNLPKTREPDGVETDYPAEPSGEAFVPADYKIAALKGPTAMGLVKLMQDSGGVPNSGAPGTGTSGNHYTFTLAGAADEVTPALIKGELDMACVPANLAAVLYQKTEGALEVLAVNTLGVLYIVENGNAVQSLEDLRSMTIVAAGKGSTPEYALRYLLRENGLDPDDDVLLDWKSEHSECVAALASGAATVALLPQPFVTAAQSKLPDLRVAVDLNDAWDALENDSGLITGVIVARRAVIDENPAAADAFLAEYAASVDWVNANVRDAAALIAEYGILEAATVAEKALPHCNIVCLTGPQMAEKLSGYLRVLYDADPAAVGGDLPDGEFYYGG